MDTSWKTSSKYFGDVQMRNFVFAVTLSLTCRDSVALFYLRTFET